MKEHEYNARSRDANGGSWGLPAIFFTEDGQYDPEKMLSYLHDNDFVGYSIDDRMVFSPELEEIHPEVVEVLTTILRDAEQAKMDTWVELGLATEEINSKAEHIYRSLDGTRLMNSRGMVP